MKSFKLKFKIDFKYLTAAIVALVIAYMTATGFILNFIKFADVLNEIAFFVCAMTLGTMMLFASFTKK